MNFLFNYLIIYIKILLDGILLILKVFLINIYLLKLNGLLNLTSNFYFNK